MNPTNRKATDDEVIAALRENGNSKRAAAEALGISRSSLQGRCRTLALRGWSPEHNLTHPTAPGQKLRGQSALYRRGEAEPILEWVKSKEDPDRIRAIIDECVAAAQDDLPKIKAPRAPRSTDDALLAAYPIGDAHIGMRAWDEECGENWDLAIAERVQCQAMADLVTRAPAAKSAVIVNLGDWFHYDNIEAVTSRSGNVLDVDGRYAKMIRVGIKVMRTCIEQALAKHGNVTVVNVIGNHDDTGAIWLSQALAHMYGGNARVRISTNPSAFTYFQHGKCLVGAHHGHTTKPAQLPGIMAADQPDMWGATRHRYWWLGHVHHQRVFEFPGCFVESFNTLAAKDAYAANHGYRAARNMKCIVLHDELGEVERHTVVPRVEKARD